MNTFVRGLCLGTAVFAILLGYELVRPVIISNVARQNSGYGKPITIRLCPRCREAESYSAFRFRVATCRDCRLGEATEHLRQDPTPRMLDLAATVAAAAGRLVCEDVLNEARHPIPDLPPAPQ